MRRGWTIAIRSPGADAEVGRRGLGDQHLVRAARRPPTRDPRRPDGIGREVDLGHHLDRLAAGTAQRRGQAQSAVHPRDLRQAGDRRDGRGRRRACGRSSVTRRRSGARLSCSASLRSTVAREGVEHPRMETATATTAPMPSTVSRVRRGARSTLRSGIWAMLDPGSGRRLASSGARPLPRAERKPARIASTGVTPQAAPDRDRGGEERQHQADRGAAGRRRRARSGVRITGSGSRSSSDAAEDLSRRSAARRATPSSDAEQRDLHAQQQRPDRQLARRDAERHADADLAPLRLDDAARQVEGGERGAGEDRKAKTSNSCWSPPASS